MEGDHAWYLKEGNSGTGYTWKYRPDNSGVYEMVEEDLLHTSPPPGMVGTPYLKAWKFKGVRPGRGSVLFESYPPGSARPEQIEKVTIIVN